MRSAPSPPQLLERRSQARHLLGHGAHPAPERRRHHPRGHQRPPAARRDRPPRCRALPGARPQQCPGRPHHGHLRENARVLPRRPRPRVRHLTRPASTATTPSPPSTPCTAAPPRSSSRSAGISSRPRRTPAYTAAALRRCELTVHVSTKLNRSHLVTGRTALDPALPRPQRARWRGAIRHL